MTDSILPVTGDGKPQDPWQSRVSDTVRHIYDRSASLLFPQRVIAAANAEAQAALIRADTDQEIMDRVADRLRAREIRRQANIETITEQAAKLPPPDRSSEEAVSQDWTTRFFEDCQDVSEPQLQAIWSGILAGEIARPRSFHVKTLHVLRDMGKDDLTSFSTLGRLTWFVPGAGFAPIVPADNNVALRQIGLHLSSLSQLEHLGLILLQPLGVNVPKQLEMHPQYCGKAYSHYAPRELDFPIGIVSYTAAGLQLLRFTGAQGGDDIRDIALDFWKSNSWTTSKSDVSIPPAAPAPAANAVGG